MENKQAIKVVDMVETALFTAIIVLLAFSPLGYIPLGTVNATTVHIPVIIAGVILGYRKGAVTGFLFGLTSFLRASFFAPSITSFLFTPLYPGGNFFSLIICFVPRILIGVAAAYTFNMLKRLTKNEIVSLAAAGVAGSLTNTVLVMGMAYIFFADQFAAAVGQETAKIFGYILGSVIIGNGIPEAVLAGFLTVGIGKVLLVVNKNRVNR